MKPKPLYNNLRKLLLQFNRIAFDSKRLDQLSMEGNTLLPADSPHSPIYDGVLNSAEAVKKSALAGSKFCVELLEVLEKQCPKMKGEE